MATFRLLPGGTAKIDGRVVKPGETVKHSADLTKLFKNRFELVSGKPGTLPEDGGDEDPTPVETGFTPVDVPTTRKSHPGAQFAAKEPPAPTAEEQAPVTRPANAPRGGTSDEGGGEVSDDEPVDDGEEAPDAEEAEEAPARAPRATRTAAKPATTRKGATTTRRNSR